jgi:hypothetical protein
MASGAAVSSASYGLIRTVCIAVEIRLQKILSFRGENIDLLQLNGRTILGTKGKHRQVDLDSCEWRRGAVRKYRVK